MVWSCMIFDTRNKRFAICQQVSEMWFHRLIMNAGKPFLLRLA